MRLEGTLDAFSLPDIFQLLSYTKKTGTLHLRRADEHGVVHLHDGLVTGARSDVRRQALARRIVGSGLVDDDVLSSAVAHAQATPCGLARALADSELVPAARLRDLAVEQSTDAVFDLMRWPEGEFAFVVDESNPDDVGAAQAVEEVVAEARRRMEAWAASAAPAPDAVVSIVTAPDSDPVLSRDDWSLLALVDGRRTVADLVDLAGSGEFVVVSALSGLIERGLLTLEAPSARLSVRQQLLAQLEGESAPAPVVDAPAAVAPPAAVEPPPASVEPPRRPRRQKWRGTPSRSSAPPRSSRSGRSPSPRRASPSTPSRSRRTPAPLLRSELPPASLRPRRSVRCTVQSPCSPRRRPVSPPPSSGIRVSTRACSSGSSPALGGCR